MRSAPRSRAGSPGCPRDVIRLAEFGRVERQLGAVDIVDGVNRRRDDGCVNQLISGGVMLVACALLLAACQDKSGADYNVGPGSDTKPDARVYKDAAPDGMPDAPPDAQVFLDAQLYARSCTNGTPFFADGNEHLTLSVVCQSPADAVAIEYQLVSGTDTKAIDTTLQCLPGGVAANNTLVFPVTNNEDFRVVRGTTLAFFVPCT